MQTRSLYLLFMAGASLAALSACASPVADTRPLPIGAFSSSVAATGKASIPEYDAYMLDSGRAPWGVCPSNMVETGPTSPSAACGQISAPARPGSCITLCGLEERKLPRAVQAVNRSLALVEKSLAEYPRHNGCFSCHHQGVAALALSVARTHGYGVEDAVITALARHTASDLRTDLENYRQGKGQPGGVTRAGYALFALQLAGVNKDELTAAVSGYILKRQTADGFWHAGSHRPPAEASDFTDTFLALRGLNSYGERDEVNARAPRIERARAWLEQASPKDTEDSVFQLWGLKEAGAANAVLERCARALLAQQKSDGGWAQMTGAASDAYATGAALTVLRSTGQLTSDDPACRRAVAFLLDTQEPDGSWHVVSRSKPVQPYFESGFPHGKDQFISVAATSWAITALVLTEGHG